jgi:carboxymethylenebutenolidase
VWIAVLGEAKTQGAQQLMASTIIGEQVEIVVDEGSTAMHGYLSRPASPGPYSAVIVCHELFAVTTDIRGVADQLAELGYLAVAPEFYHRTAVPGAVFERTADGRTHGFEQLHQLSRDHALRDIAATLRYLSNRADTTPKTAIVGFSAGGHIAYLAATQFDLAAAVVLYGGWLPTGDIALSQPEPTVTLTPGIRGPLLYLVGGADAVISPAEREQIRRALDDAHIRHELHVYPDVAHAFFWEGTENFNRDARDDAWQRITQLLAEQLAC